MSIKQAIRKAVYKFLVFLFGLFDTNNKERMKSLACDVLRLKNEEEVILESEYGVIKFYVVNDLTRWRINTFYKKEPETIRWIDEFNQNDVFWDIGANIGIYSIYAAKKGLNVFSFEPESSNYKILNKNIFINSLQTTMSAYCLAFDDKSSIGKLGMTMIDEGGSMSTFEKNKTNQNVKFAQGMIGISIDEFIKKYDPLFPNYIKIDVDGNEINIIKGAEKTLKDERLKKISIELDENDNNDLIINILTKCGFSYIKNENSEMFTNSKFCNIYNYHFSK